MPSQNWNKTNCWMFLSLLFVYYFVFFFFVGFICGIHCVVLLCLPIRVQAVETQTGSGTKLYWSTLNHLVETELLNSKSNKFYADVVCLVFETFPDRELHVGLRLFSFSLIFSSLCFFFCFVGFFIRTERKWQEALSSQALTEDVWSVSGVTQRFLSCQTSPMWSSKFRVVQCLRKSPEWRQTLTHFSLFLYQRLQQSSARVPELYFFVSERSSAAAVEGFPSQNHRSLSS